MDLSRYDSDSEIDNGELEPEQIVTVMMRMMGPLSVERDVRMRQILKLVIVLII